MATPVNSKLPVISGIAEVDRVLECHAGTWSESPTYTYQWKNAGSPISGATGKLYLVDATDQGDAITCTVTATSGVDSDTATTAAVTPGAANYAAGYRATYNAGTDGDWFVDQATGDDGNAGTSTGAAFETIGAAVSAASGGDTIRVRSGTYRETVDLSGLSGTEGNPTRLLGYGTEKPVITGADALTSWTQCDSGDEATVGANYANIYKKTVTNSTIASGDPRGAFIHEDGVALPIVVSQLPDPKYPLFYNVPDQWHEADTVNIDGSDKILSFELPSLTDDYTAAQIENCDVYFHVYPNKTAVSAVDDFDEINDRIVLSDQTQTYEDNSNRDKFALLNLLPAMTAGTWGFKDNGDGTTTLYLWPNDTDNLTSVIEYSTRGNGIVLGSSSYITVGSLVVRQVSSAGTATDGKYAITAKGLTKSNNIELTNVLVKNNYRSPGGYAPVWLQNVDDHSVQCVEVDTAIGQYGMFFQGGSTSGDDLGMASDGRVDSCKVVLSASSPYRMFGQRSHILSFCTASDCGLAAHANKANYYALCQACMFYGCNFLGASGYLTWSAASAVSVVGCILPTNYEAGDNRAIQDQNRGGDPTPASELSETGVGYILNNIFLPYAQATTASNSLNVGNANRPECTYVIHNNVIHGASGTDQDYVDSWDYNLMTAGSTVGGNDETDTITGMYENYAVGDYEIKVGATVRTMTAKDLSTEIAVLESRYPDFHGFGRDLVGNAIDWSDPPIGPVDDYDAGYDFDPFWVDLPALSGVPLPGETLGVDLGFLAASPYPTITYQWQRSDDAITWANITDETSSTYDTVEGDGGKYIGCLVTPGSGAVHRAATADALLIEEYPIKTPTLLDTSTAAASATLETPEITVSEKPIFVLVAFKGTSSAANVTATIGTEARESGGDSLTHISSSLRTNTHTHLLWIKDPGTGSKTVQVAIDQTPNAAMRVDTVEIEGVDTIGVEATGGFTGTSKTTTVTTEGTNSLVLHTVSRISGSDSDPLGVTGATEISEGNDGGTNTSSNQRTLLAYELATSPGAFDAIISWTSSLTYAWQAIELKSAAVTTATVTTADATFVTSSTATLGGNVTDDGGGIIIEQGVCWGLTENPTVDDFKATSATGVGAFAVNATGLLDDTTYHHRAYAISTAGTSYGTDKTFTTDAADTTDPTVSTVTIAVNGDDVTLAMSEDVTATDWSGFSISGTNLTYASGSGTSTILFTADSTLSAGTKTLDYDPPVDGVQDGAGNLLAPIDGMAVTNNVPSEGGDESGAQVIVLIVNYFR